MKAKKILALVLSLVMLMGVIPYYSAVSAEVDPSVAGTHIYFVPNGANATWGSTGGTAYRMDTGEQVTLTCGVAYIEEGNFFEATDGVIVKKLVADEEGSMGVIMHKGGYTTTETVGEDGCTEVTVNTTTFRARRSMYITVEVTGAPDTANDYKTNPNFGGANVNAYCLKDAPDGSLLLFSYNTNTWLTSDISPLQSGETVVYVDSFDYNRNTGLAGSTKLYTFLDMKTGKTIKATYDSHYSLRVSHFYVVNNGVIIREAKLDGSDGIKYVASGSFANVAKDGYIHYSIKDAEGTEIDNIAAKVEGEQLYNFYACWGGNGLICNGTTYLGGYGGNVSMVYCSDTSAPNPVVVWGDGNFPTVYAEQNGARNEDGIFYIDKVTKLTETAAQGGGYDYTATLNMTTGGVTGGYIHSANPLEVGYFYVVDDGVVTREAKLDGTELEISYYAPYADGDGKFMVAGINTVWTSGGINVYWDNNGTFHTLQRGANYLGDNSGNAGRIMIYPAECNSLSTTSEAPTDKHITVLMNDAGCRYPQLETYVYINSDAAKATDNGESASPRYTAANAVDMFNGEFFTVNSDIVLEEGCFYKVKGNTVIEKVTVGTDIKFTDQQWITDGDGQDDGMGFPAIYVDGGWKLGRAIGLYTFSNQQAYDMDYANRYNDYPGTTFDAYYYGGSRKINSHAVVFTNKYAMRVVGGQYNNFGYAEADFAVGISTAVYNSTLDPNPEARVKLVKDLAAPATVSAQVVIDKNGHNATINAGAGYATYENDDIVTVKKLDFTQSVTLYATEPWGLIFGCKAKLNSAIADYDNDFDSYGVYVLAAEDLGKEVASVDEVTAEDITANEKVKAYTSTNNSDKFSIEEINEENSLQFLYDEELYTYEMDKSYYVMFYVVADGNTYYAPIRERSVSATLETMQGESESYAEAINELVDAMDALSESTKAYLGDHKVNITSNEPDVLENVSDIYQATYEVSDTYDFHFTTTFSTAEPWATIYRARVSANGSDDTLDLDTFADYGAVIFYDRDGEFDYDTFEGQDLLNRSDALVYSKSNTAAEEESEYFADRILVKYVKGLYTYQMDKTAYVVFFVKDGDTYHFSEIRERKVIDTLNSIKDVLDTSDVYGQQTKKVIEDMIYLFNKTKAYRQSIIK